MSCECTTAYACDLHRASAPVAFSATPTIAATAYCRDCGGRGWTVRTGACSCIVSRVAALERIVSEQAAILERLRQEREEQA